MGDDFKKYDSDDKYINWNARLAKDPEIREGENGKMVRLTFVSTSKAESDSELWIEATPSDRQADIAAFLKKGDVLGIEGKPCLRRYGDNKEKFSFNLRRAELHIPISLFVALKERGFVPGAKAEGKSARPTTKKAPAKTVLKLDEEE